MSTIKSPDAILLTRMNIHVPSDSQYKFSILEFPYADAIKEFTDRFEPIYKRQHMKNYAPSLPYRQLNSALLALAPSLIQGFEEGSDRVARMVSFTRYTNTGRLAEDFPSPENLQALIRLWLHRWSISAPTITAVLEGDGKAAWDTLLQVVSDEPKYEWHHDVSPSAFLNDMKYDGGIVYNVIPALVTQLLHGKTMTIYSAKQAFEIQWRRANSGEKDGSYLLSQPIRSDDDYFAYQLKFSLQTQSGRVDKTGNSIPWLFADLSIQRYVTEPLKHWNDRNISVLVGNNGEKWCGWEQDSSLIRLPITREKQGWVWADGVGGLLNNFALRSLLSPELITSQPAQYGNYHADSLMTDDEYRIVYAEGMQFGESKYGRKHQVPTGTSLRERSSVINGVLMLLDMWVSADTPIPIDMQNVRRSYAQYDHAEMVKDDKSGKKKTAWREMLRHTLQSSGYEHVEIAVLYRDCEFLQDVLPELEAALMEVNTGDMPLVTVTPHPLSPLLTVPLDAGELDPQLHYDSGRPSDFYEKWNAQMMREYTRKRQQWRDFLGEITWKPNARRMALIDSLRLPKEIHPDQAIKAAVRDACNRAGISSQFLYGTLTKDRKKPEKLSGESSGRVNNAIRDLIIRQQGILFAPPSELYQAAGINSDVAANLDVITFCRIEKQSPKFHYAIAVRLRADGTVHVLLPNGDRWLTYEEGMYTVGTLFSDQRVVLMGRGNKKAASPLRLSLADLRLFAKEALTTKLERPTIAVIEAEKWRNSANSDVQKQGWTQLQNENLAKWHDQLWFNQFDNYPRSSPALSNLIAVVRLRMDTETPQYVTADDYASEETMRDIRHATGYVDTTVTTPFHYFSVAALSGMQRKAGQDSDARRELFKADPKDEDDEIAFKHPQLVEMVPFFVRPDFQHDDGLRQICRCVHLLRISPGFTMGDILLPYPMHLGKALVEDQFCIIGLCD